MVFKLMRLCSDDGEQVQQDRLTISAVGLKNTAVLDTASEHLWVRVPRGMQQSIALKTTVGTPKPAGKVLPATHNDL